MPPKKALFGNRGGKGGKGKGKGGRYDNRGYRDDGHGYGSRSDWGISGNMTDTATGETDMAHPGTMEDTTTTGALAPEDHLRPTHATVIILSHR